MNESTPHAKTIVYEYPLNERVRTFLRLEFLFNELRFGMAGHSAWHSRVAVTALLDIVSLLTRSDVRSELQKELDRLLSHLQRLRERPEVDGNVLEPLLEECQRIGQSLRAAPTGTPAVVRDNEFLASIEQRAGVLGGTCAFDIPAYHLWLESPAEHRQALLKSWHEAFTLTDQGSALVLRILRDSGEPAQETAHSGCYQAMLERDATHQLLRVTLPTTAQHYPEISGSRHFCNIRFLHQATHGERPQQVHDDVQFSLERCGI